MIQLHKRVASATSTYNNFIELMDDTPKKSFENGGTSRKSSYVNPTEYINSIILMPIQIHICIESITVSRLGSHRGGSGDSLGWCPGAVGFWALEYSHY